MHDFTVNNVRTAGKAANYVKSRIPNVLNMLTDDERRILPVSVVLMSSDVKSITEIINNDTKLISIDAYGTKVCEPVARIKALLIAGPKVAPTP